MNRIRVTRPGVHRGRILGAGLVACLVLAGAVGAVRFASGAQAGCQPLAEGAIAESQRFTPYEQRMSHLRDAPLNPEGLAVAALPPDELVPGETVDGLPVQWAVQVQDGSVYRYFSTSKFGPDVTLPDFLVAGGIELDRNPTSAGGDVVSELAATLGARAVAIDVGPHKGILTWADPMANGVRPHYLSWSDGTANYTIVADRSAVALVSLVRGLICH